MGCEITAISRAGGCVQGLGCKLGGVTADIQVLSVLHAQGLLE